MVMAVDTVDVRDSGRDHQPYHPDLYFVLCMMYILFGEETFISMLMYHFDL